MHSDLAFIRARSAAIRNRRWPKPNWGRSISARRTPAVNLPRKQTANLGRDAADIGLGPSSSLGDTKTITLYVRYDCRISANATENAVTLGGKYSR